MTFAHLILTRYNIRFWYKASETLKIEPAWLEHRLGLFFRYTFPSIAAQDVRGFTWLVFVDPETPEWVIRQLERDRAAANMHLIATPAFDPQFAAQIARQHIRASVTHLVTTTLDNDDALARTFVGHLQSHVRAVEFELINLVQGFRLVEQTGSLYRCQLRSNPFITAVEKIDAAKTIWAYLPHATILQRVKEVRDVMSEPMWLQVVHERNLAPTAAWGLTRARGAELRSRFSIGADAHLDERGGLRVWFENVRRRIERLIINCLNPHIQNRLRHFLRNRLGSR